MIYVSCRELLVHQCMFLQIILRACGYIVSLVITSTKHTVFVRTSKLINYIVRVQPIYLIDFVSNFYFYLFLIKSHSYVLLHEASILIISLIVCAVLI